MSETVPYGLRSPNPNDPPDVPEDIQKLAEDVNGELVRVDQDQADQDDAIAAAGLGWVPIGSGDQANVSAFVIDLTAAGKWPAGTFSLMRFYFRGQMDNATQWLTLNVNDSLTSESHRSNWLAHDADGNLDENGSDDLQTWRLAFWSGAILGSTASATLFNTDTTSFISFEGTGGMPAGSSGASRRSLTWGRLNENRLPSSLRVGRVGSNNIDHIRWWAEGWRDA